MSTFGFEYGRRNVSLNAATATGAGDAFGLVAAADRYLPAVFAWDVIITGSPTAVQVDLEGSVDGTNWYQLGTYSGTSNTLQFSANKKAIYVRARLVTLTGGSSPTISTGIAA